MALAHIRLGLPMGGMDQESRKRVTAPDEDKWAAADISGLRFETGRQMRPFPVATTYADTLDANRVNGLRAVRWGDSSADVVRHSQSNFAELAGGAWTTRNPAAGFGASTAADYWGGAVCAGNTGKGFYVFSNRVVGPFKWTGAAAIATSITTGAPSPARHVVPFADRCVLFNQLVGGNIRGRRSQWSLPGDSDVWSGVGSGAREMAELEGEITGASVIRNGLFVYSNKGVLAGGETYLPQAPIAYTPVVSKGVGNIAPNSLLSDNDVDRFLSHEGFKEFNGGSFTPIGGAVDSYILSRITRSALATVCGFVKPEWSTAFWALPMDGATLPTEGWAYNWKRQHWTRVDLGSLYPSASRPTAFAVVDQGAAIAWNDASLAGLAWNDASLATKRWIDFLGTAELPSVVSGHSNGVTRSLDEVSAPTVAITIETPDFTFEGVALVDRAGRAVRAVRPGGIIAADCIEITYRTISGAGTLYVLVSTDGGQTFTNYGAGGFGAVTLPALTGDAASTVRVFGRAAGHSLRFRVTNVNRSTGATSACAVMIEDIAVRVKDAGESRGAA